jgi:alpha-tubulin suppressor-like RCC1 family protein
MPIQLFSQVLSNLTLESNSYLQPQTLISAAGNVWAFGCGLFGQLGNGDNKKHSNPIRLDFRRTLRYEGIDDKIAQIATKFFHCLALSTDGQRVYMWGCSPQVIELFFT